MTASKWLSRVRRPIRVPGGVADPAGACVYLEAVAGGIEAVDLESGAPLWNTEAASIPVLGLRGGLLAAALTKDDEVRLRVLSAERGSIVLDCDPVARLPGGAWYPLRCRAERKKVLIDWLSRVLKSPPKHSAMPVENPVLRGCFALDLEDGSLSEVPWRGPEPPSWPEGAEALDLMPDTAGDSRPWRVGKTVVALAYDHDRTPTALRLHRWDKTGKPLRSKILLASVPAPGFLEHHRTHDEEHVYLLRCNDRPKDGAAPGSLCEWIVFTVPEGKRILTLPMSTGIGPPMTVLANRLLYEWAGPALAKRSAHLREIRAADLDTGNQVWTRPLRGFVAALNI